MLINDNGKSHYVLSQQQPFANSRLHKIKYIKYFIVIKVINIFDEDINQYRAVAG